MAKRMIVLRGETRKEVEGGGREGEASHQHFVNALETKQPTH